MVVATRLVTGLGGPPLYDGVVPVGPYLWLNPAQGQQGGAKGAAATVTVNAGQNDIVALATSESLPQAQVLAVPGALILPPGATSLNVSIEPVAAPGQPSDGVLNSNVYRFVVKDQSGADATARASARVSIVLRSADAALPTGTVERWDGTAWVPLKTPPPGVSGAYLTVVTQFGDYAVVRPGSSGPSATPAASAGQGASASSGAAPSGTAVPLSTPTSGGDAGSGGASLVLPLVGAAAAALLALVVMLLLGRRSGPPPAPPASGGAAGVRRQARDGQYRGAHRIDRE